MKYKQVIKIFFWGALLALFIFPSNVHASPHLANYYLGVLPSDQDSISKLAKTDLLILSPDQFITHASTISEFRKKNPDIILLAYVPSQSYNVKYWRDDLVFKNMNIRDEWWLRDKNGNIVSNWPGLQNINLDNSWSEYLVQFINNNVTDLQNVDGVFFDIVNESISGMNRGNIVLGNATTPSELNAEWASRMKYLLTYARNNLNTKYIVINGSSFEGFQAAINGRMYETFPTPWEAGGSWSGIMTKLEKNKSLNQQPKIYIFNANTNNSGKKDDYKKMRFGLASSLMTDNVFFSFDFGDQNHGQTWWYDEYDMNLGTPVGKARPDQGDVQLFQNDVWEREYSNGLAVVNPTGQDQVVVLPGEYEKLAGTQDKAVNDGSIVEKVKLASKDGILLYKAQSSVEGVLFGNGNFIRFFDDSGHRTRNGFFAFEDGLRGGAKVYKGDLDGEPGNEKVVITGPKMEIFDKDGNWLYQDFPFGSGNYKGNLNLSIGDMNGDGQKEIIVGASTGGKVLVFNYYGGVVKKDLYPLGNKYKRSIYPAVLGNGGSASIAMLADNELIVVGKDYKIKKRLYPFGKSYKGPMAITAGDFSGDGKKEIALAYLKKNLPYILIYSDQGKKIREFKLNPAIDIKKINIGAADPVKTGKDELVVMTSN